MQTEIEAKFSSINPGLFRRVLAQVGAQQVYVERLMRRKNFDYPDMRLGKNQKGWVRVRDEGDKVTLSYKQLNDRTLHGTKEISLVVDDFDQTVLFLESIGLVQFSYQETKRELWKLNEVEVTIDTWPWVPSFIELEGPSEDQVKAVASTLGLDWSKALHGSVEIIYQQHYKVTEAEVDSWPSITFVPTPKDLVLKRKAAV